MVACAIVITCYGLAQRGRLPTGFGAAFDLGGGRLERAMLGPLLPGGYRVLPGPADWIALLVVLGAILVGLDLLCTRREQPRVQASQTRPRSVYRWIEGDPATLGRVTDLTQFAADLSGFLLALYQVDSAGGPSPGEHNFFRGGPLAVYDSETGAALAALDGEIDTGRAAQVWAAALAATWAGPPCGSTATSAPGNLLVDQGRLSAVIDFGSSGVGDPACNTAIAWTFFSGESRRMFQSRLPVDQATWAQGRGWALWKAMIVLVGALKNDPDDATQTRRVIEEVLAAHEDAR